MSKKKIFLYILMLITAHISLIQAWAENSNFNNGFDQGLNAAISQQGKTDAAIQNLKPESFIKNYSANPKEANYLNDVSSLKNDAIQSSASSTIGKSITQGMDDRKSQFNYSVDPNSQNIQNIQKRADDIYSVVAGQFGDCTKQTSCMTNYDTKSCEESPKKMYQYCRKNLTIDLIPHQVDTHYYLNAHLSVDDHNYAGININAVNGHINFLGPHDASFQLDGRLPSNIDCHSLQGKIVSNQAHANLDYLNFPSCNNGLALDFHISGGHSIDLKIDMVSSKIVYEPQDNWQDDCSGFANTKTCSFEGEHCISPAATRNIQSVTITRDCWEKEASYVCGSGIESTMCQDYRNAGCEQISSICKNRNDSGCTLYQQTFRCPSKQCTDTGMICNGQTYCLTGDCVKQQKQADPDFQKGVTGLSVVNEAAKSYNLNQGANFPIFGGQVKSCNKDFLNFANCCSDNGWGVDFHLAQCDQESKELGKAKENGTVIYIDSDDNCVLGGLCSHKKRYCVFPSKLARIIQENGRRDQLHISFGNYDHPDCRGLSPSEFSQLDLKQVNFSEVYSDITKDTHLEDQEHLNQRVSEKMQDWSKEKTPHG